MSNGGNGGGGGGGGAHAGDSNSNSGSGTEYTLQGVMRFLQMEWHNHERARNAWDIERAEMKAKIAKQEGENRRAIKLNDQLDRHVRMLENALKRERAKSQALINGGGKLPENFDDYLWSKSDSKKESKGSSEATAALSSIRNAGKEALQRAVEEISYLISTSQHPTLPTEGQVSLGDQQSLDVGDPYFHPHQQMHQTSLQRPNHTGQAHHGLLNKHEHVSSDQDQHSLPLSHQTQTDSYQNTPYGSAFLQADKIPPSHDIRQSVSHIPDQFSEESGGWNWETSQSSQEDSGHHGGNVRGPPSSALSTVPRSLPRSGSKSSTKLRSKLSGPRRGFHIRFELCGHLDVVRSVIFTGGGSQTGPEICTAGDDGVIKRWVISPSHPSMDIQSFMTHRGHEGSITCLAPCSASPVKEYSHDGSWIFSGGQDGTIKLWERDRVEAVTTIHEHADAVWALRVLPGVAGSVFGLDHPNIDDPNSLLLVSGSADGTVKVWAVSPPQRLPTPPESSQMPHLDGSQGARFGPEDVGVFVTVNLLHSIQQEGFPSPTCIAPFSPVGFNFVVSYNDASILIINTLTGEVVSSMASKETYNNTIDTAVNAVVAIPSHGLELQNQFSKEDGSMHGATGSLGDGGVEGMIISGHEDEFIRIFDANSGQCTYSMRAHPAAISSLSLASTWRDVQEVVSAGHDGGVRIWDLRKRSCIQEFSSHRVMRDEGACCVAWGPEPFSQYLVSVGGDSVVKVYTKVGKVG